MSTIAQLPDVAQRNPFKFLNAFKRDEGDSFKGRDEEVELLYDLVRRRNIVLVFGESGVGKTSLIQCGLANKFQSADWYDVLILRKGNINTSLREALKKRIENENTDKDNASIVALIDALYIQNFKPVYLVFDQMEELYVGGDEQERETFYSTISSILEIRNSYCKIIFVIREDFHAKLNDFGSKVAQLFNTGLEVTRMKSAYAEEVTTRALEENASFVTADPDINEISRLIVKACTSNGVVHLLKLQILLHILYNEASTVEETGKRLFSKKLIEQVTRVDDLLKEYVKKTVQFISKENEKAAWSLLGRFITPKNTKKPCRIDELYDVNTMDIDVDFCIHQLIEKQVLRMIDENYLELVHDSLIPIIQFFQPKSTRPRLAAPVLEGNPYKGLLPYDESDAGYFYGRHEVIQELYEKVKKSPITPVVGASGAGKSSLIKAGLLPKLRENGFHILPVIKPGKFPDDNIDQIITNIGQNTASDKYVLYIDQYEEVVSQCEDHKSRQKFIEFLLSLIEQPHTYFKQEIELKILLSVRSDFEPQVQRLYLEQYWKAGRFTVPPFSKDQLREIIEEPAYLAGLEFYPASLVETIAGEVDRSSNLLPLFSYTLSELYVAYSRSGRTDGFLTQDDYENLGGVVGGLSKRADAIYDCLDEGERRSLHNVFMRMLSLSSGELAGRRAAAAEFVYSDINETNKVCSILNSLLRNRLIICSKDSERNVFYEPAHDSLVRSWGKLWSWINEADGKETLSLQSQLRGALLTFKEGVLWDTNTRLELLGEIITSEDNWLNKQETDFVLASIQKRKELADVKERNEEEKKQLNQKLLEEQQKANLLLQQKLTEEQKSSLLLAQKLEEQQKAEQLVKEKLEEQKKRTALLKRSKVGLITGLVGLTILAGTSIYFALLSSKNKEKKEKILNAYFQFAKNTAENQKKQALLLYDSTINLLDNNRVLLNVNISLVSKYKAEKEKAEKAGRLSQLANIELGKSMVEKNNEVVKYKDLINKYEHSLARVELQKEPFYYSRIDSSLKEQYVDSLIAMKLDEKNLDTYSKLKSALNKLADALREERQNPNKGLALAKQAYDMFPAKVIDSIGLIMANNNLFYTYKLEVPDRIGLSRGLGPSGVYLTALSKDKSHFAFATPNGIRTGVVRPDSLTIDRQILSDYVNAEKSLYATNDFDPQARLVALAYTDDSSLIAVTRDRKIYTWNNTGQMPVVKNIPASADDSVFSLVAVTANGKKLVSTYKDARVKVFDLERGLTQVLKDSFSIKDGYISKLVCAPEGKKAIVLNSNSKCWIVDMEAGASRQVDDLPVLTANFTPDGKNIVYEGKDSIWMSDLDGNKTGRKMYKSGSIIIGYPSHEINMHADWKSLVLHIMYTGNRYFENLAETGQKDSLFYYGIRDRVNIRDVFFNADGVFDFLTSNSMLAYSKPYYADSSFNLLLLKKHERFGNFLNAYASVNPYLTEKDKKDIGLKQLSESDKYEEAKRYYDQSLDYSISKTAKRGLLLKAKNLFDNLLAANEENEDYLNNLKTIDRSLYYSLDSNYNTYSVELKRHIEMEKNLLKKYGNDTSSFKYKYYRKTLATDYGNLSYYLLLVDQPDFSAVVDAGEKGLAYDSTVDFIYTNLALGNLLNKDTVKAKNIYTMFKGKYSNVLHRSFTSAFLEDLTVLERRNVISMKEPKVYSFTQRVKCWLKSEPGCTLK